MGLAEVVGATDVVEAAGYGDMLDKAVPLNETSGAQENRETKDCRGAKQATRRSD